MENTKKIISPFPIELYYEDSSELTQLKDPKNPFSTSVLEHSLEYVKHAIENKLDKVYAFNMVNLGIRVYLTLENYSSIIDIWLGKYLEEEKYDKCAELRDLKAKIDEIRIPLESRPI
jgi:hypothetical protein